MNVVCKTKECPYNSGMGCIKRVVILNSNGTCSTIYTPEGQIKRNIFNINKEELKNGLEREFESRFEALGNSRIDKSNEKLVEICERESGEIQSTTGGDRKEKDSIAE